MKQLFVTGNDKGGKRFTGAAKAVALAMAGVPTTAVSASWQRNGNTQIVPPGERMVARPAITATGTAGMLVLEAESRGGVAKMGGGTVPDLIFSLLCVIFPLPGIISGLPRAIFPVPTVIFGEPDANFHLPDAISKLARGISTSRFINLGARLCRSRPAAANGGVSKVFEAAAANPTDTAALRSVIYKGSSTIIFHGGAVGSINN